MTARPATTDALCAALIATIEGGVRLKAYRDSGGVLTIGIGHTGPDVREGLIITYEKAMALFAADQAPLLSLLSGYPPLAAAAYASFGYNCGTGALKKVLAGADTVTNPVHTTDRRGIVQPGLVSRRNLEAAMLRAA